MCSCHGDGNALLLSTSLAAASDVLLAASTPFSASDGVEEDWSVMVDGSDC